MQMLGDHLKILGNIGKAGDFHRTGTGWGRSLSHGKTVLSYQGELICRFPLGCQAAAGISPNPNRETAFSSRCDCDNSCCDELAACCASWLFCCVTWVSVTIRSETSSMLWR